MTTDYMHRNHFRNIAPRYRSLRSTDMEPITFIVGELNTLREIKAVDIGCGTGRYTQVLIKYLRDNLLSMYCIDYSASMLTQLNHSLAKKGIHKADSIKASATDLPLGDESMNCIFTFNAVHHFGLIDFLLETARILQDGGYLFIYTRLRSQNRRNVWGRFFPLFNSKETRLFELDELGRNITKIPNFRLKHVHRFKFNRESSLERLSNRAKRRFYSTFDLYTRSEFNTALNKFHENIREHFDDPTNIQWFDENILLTLQKTG